MWKTFREPCFPETDLLIEAHGCQLDEPPVFSDTTKKWIQSYFTKDFSDVHWCAGTTFPIRDYLGLWHGYIITNLITAGRKYSSMYNKTAIEHGWVIPRYCRLWMRFVPNAKPGFSNVNLNPTHHNGCNYLSMLGLRLIHVSKRGYCCTYLLCFVAAWHMIFYTTESFYTYTSH